MSRPVRIEIPSVVFRRERRDTWRELETIVGRVEEKGIASLGADELYRLPALYRATLSSLSVARAITLDRALIDYLESLAARAYLLIYSPRRRVLAVLAVFFARLFPRAFRAIALPVLVAANVLVAGVLTGFVLVRDEPARFFEFVPADLAGPRGPDATRDEMLEVLYPDVGEEDALATFSSFLFKHNTGVGLLCFSLGVLFGIPTLLLLFATGTMLGAFAAIHHAKGLSVDLWGWILPHGIPELGAIVVCGGAGLALGRAIAFPGAAGILESMRRTGRTAGLAVMGTLPMFLVAGLIEGVFRQRVHDVTVRYAVAGAGLFFWSLYLGCAGRRGGDE